MSKSKTDIDSAVESHASGAGAAIPVALPAPVPVAAQPDPVPTSKTIAFRDTVYTSRTLILGDRTLTVAKGRVEVPEDDAAGLEFLAAHPELERLE